MSTILDQLSHHANDRPDQTALIALRPGQRVERVTWRELDEAVWRMASQLRQRLQQPAVVPILAAKTADCVVAMLAILASGSAFAVLNRKLKAPQLNASVSAARPPFGVIDREGAAIVAANAAEPFAQIPWLAIGNERNVPNDAAFLAQDSVDRFDFRTERTDIDAGRAPLAAGDRRGCCLFTSGSTGSPKGVLISADDLDERAAEEAKLFGLTRDDVLLNVLPFSFDVGLNQLLSSITAGSPIVLSESWLPADMLRNVAQHGITGISAVPAVWNDLLNSNLRFDSLAAHRSLRYVTISGGDLPIDRLTSLPGVIGKAHIFKTYGQSETFRSTALRPGDFANHPTSVGRAFGKALIYVVRPDGTAADKHEPGEVVHTGPGTMLGYLDGPAGNLRKNPFHGSADSNEYAIFTGDSGYLNSEGLLFIQGRNDSMLKVAGNRVYPKEIVDRILLLDEVVDAEIIGTKNSDGETSIVAFVVARPDTALQPAALRRRLITMLPNYMVPRTIVMLVSLPRTANGKVDRPALVALCDKPCDTPASVQIP